MRTKRFLIAAHVSPHDVTYNYSVGGKYVDAIKFAAALRAASMAGELTHCVTQSTGFGWRSVWERRSK